MNKVKGFSYDTEKDKDVIDYIDSKPKGSRSQYIWDLVRKDMKQDSIEILIKREIEKYLEGVELKTKVKPMEIDSSEIMNILSM